MEGALLVNMKVKRIYRPYPASAAIFTNSYTGLEYASKFSIDRVVLLFFNELPMMMIFAWTQ